MINKSEKDPESKLLNIPGIREAIALVRREAIDRAVEKTLQEGEEGELGNELQSLLTGDSGTYNIDKFLSDDKVKVWIGEIKDEQLEDLAFEAGPKIAELWGLSEPAGEKLIDIIYWGENQSTNSYLEPFTFILKPPDSGVIEISNEAKFDSLRTKAIISSPQELKEGHIYLDVTYLLHGNLSRAYNDILLMRDCLGIRSRDLREGAPESIDTDKALKSFDLASEGKISKEKIKELGFKIYTRDNPSGSYPLFRKYVELGREITQRLNALDKFLHEGD